MSWGICVRVEVVGRRRRRSVQWLMRRLREVREWGGREVEGLKGWGSGVEDDEEGDDDDGARLGFRLMFWRDIIAVGGGGGAGRAFLMPEEKSPCGLGTVVGMKEFVLRDERGNMFEFRLFSSRVAITRLVRAST